MGFLLILGAAFAAVAGAAVIAYRNDASVIAETAATGDELMFAGIVMLIGGLIQLLVGIGILNGSRIARDFGRSGDGPASDVGGVADVHAPYRGFLYHGLVTLGVGAFVLWALFNERADEYYDAHNRGAASEGRLRVPSPACAPDQRPSHDVSWQVHPGQMRSPTAFIHAREILSQVSLCERKATPSLRQARALRAPAPVHGRRAGDRP